MAIRIPAVEESEHFRRQANELKKQFSEIETVLDALKDLLILDYPIPHIPVDSDKHPRTYAVKLDYPPHDSKGLGRFLVTYQATDREAHMQNPLCTYTLLTLVVLP